MKIYETWNNHEKKIYTSMEHYDNKLKRKHPRVYDIRNRLFKLIDKYFSLILLLENILVLSLFLYTIQNIVNKFSYSYKNGFMSFFTALSIILPIQFSKFLEYIKNHEGWEICICFIMILISGVLFLIFDKGYQLIIDLWNIIIKFLLEEI